MPLIIFIFGTIIGSFLNVCVYRIPRGESVVFPGSHCPTCGHHLKWYNNIPILSFIFQKGRCGYCRGKISLQYPLIEFLNGVMYLIFYHKYGLSAEFIYYGAICGILIVLSSIDYYSGIIPDRFIFLILIFSIIYKISLYIFYSVSPQWFNSILGLLVGGLLFLTISVLSKGGMGGGDIKLIGALGFALGLKMVFLNIFLSFIIGAIISLMLIALKKKGRKDSIPFGPFICMGFLITSLWGDKLLLWYINIFWGSN